MRGGQACCSNASSHRLCPSANAHRRRACKGRVTHPVALPPSCAQAPPSQIVSAQHHRSKSLKVDASPLPLYLSRSLSPLFPPSPLSPSLSLSLPLSLLLCLYMYKICTCTAQIVPRAARASPGNQLHFLPAAHLLLYCTLHPSPCLARARHPVSSVQEFTFSGGNPPFADLIRQGNKSQSNGVRLPQVAGSASIKVLGGVA